MKCSIYSDEEIHLIRESCQLVGKTLGYLKQFIVPGMNTLLLDKHAEEYIRDNGGEPAFKNYQPDRNHKPFPYTLCTSINQVVVHGVPNKNTILQEGDIISVDCGVKKNGYFGDSAYTFSIGEVKQEIVDLLNVTRESLYLGINQACHGNRIGDVSSSVQKYVESHGFSIVKEMVGHGIGKNLHEPPEVPNFGRRGLGLKLLKGMVIAIEPMVNLGIDKIYRSASDGWSIISKDNSPSAHFEHTIAIGQTPIILSTFDFIEN